MIYCCFGAVFPTNKQNDAQIDASTQPFVIVHPPVLLPVMEWWSGCVGGPLCQLLCFSQQQYLFYCFAGIVLPLLALKLKEFLKTVPVGITPPLVRFGASKPTRVAS